MDIIDTRIRRVGQLTLLSAVLCTSALAARNQPQTKPPPTTKPPAPQSQQSRGSLDALNKVWTGDLDGMIKRRVIRVATTYNRTNYFIDKGMQRGAV